MTESKIVFVCQSCVLKNNIIAFLKERGPAYLGQIAKALGIERSTLAYHLGELEREKMITSEYRILQEPKPKGKAARFYSSK